MNRQNMKHTDRVERETMNNCLNCKYEPEWGKSVGLEFPRRAGMCRWNQSIPTKLPLLPASYRIDVRAIIRHSDDTGIPSDCKTWEAKP